MIFQNPRGVAVDAQGRIYVADAGAEHLKVFGPDGKFMRTIGPKARVRANLGPESRPGRSGLRLGGQEPPELDLRRGAASAPPPRLPLPAPSASSSDEGPAGRPTSRSLWADRYGRDRTPPTVRSGR
jgi:hypothetical protein